MAIEAGTQPIANESETVAADGIARATAVIALGNVASRVLGLVRESTFAKLFGTALAMDSFNLAIVVPRGLYDLLIGGHVNSALIPVLSDYAKNRTKEELWELVSALLWVVMLIMATLVLVIEITAPLIIQRVANSKTSPEVIEQATHLLRITAPALFFLSLFAVVSSLLYALRRFTLPAFAAAAFNLTILVVTFTMSERIGIEAAALGWLLGAIIQLGLQWVGLRDLSMSVKLILKHPGIKTVGLLYAPVMFSLSLDVLVNRLFSYNLALGAGEGAVSIMNYATTLVQFPHGLVATAISVAVLPTLARQSDDLSAFKHTLGEGLRLSLALIIPATVGLIVMATPIVALIFEHGKFTTTDTAITAFALRLYMIGLPFASIDLLLIFAFYARQDTLTPALIGLLSLVAYILTAVVLMPYYSFFALMIADSVKHFIHASVSGYLLMRRIGKKEDLRDLRLVQTTVRSTLAAFLMGLLSLVMLQLFGNFLPERTLLHELIVVVVGGGVSGIFYLLLADRLGISEIQMFLRQIKQKL